LNVLSPLQQKANKQKLSFVVAIKPLVGSRGCLPMIFLPTFFIQELSPDPYRGDLMNTIKKLTIL